MTNNSDILSPSKILVGVIGEGNNGKSTIIQSLTGCKTRSFRGYVEAINEIGDQKMLCIFCSSLQETVLMDIKKNIFANQHDELERLLNEALANTSCCGVVIAIQPTNPSARVSMEDIYDIAIRLGFNPYGYILNPPNKGNPTNAIGIKNRLTAQGVKPSNIFELDARKFGILNAETIRVTSGIIF